MNVFPSPFLPSLKPISKKKILQDFPYTWNFEMSFKIIKFNKLSLNAHCTLGSVCIDIGPSEFTETYG